MHPDYQEARKMRDEGSTLKQIAQRFGINQKSVSSILGVADYGAAHIPAGFPARPGETPEQRAFRRFPINSHKPAR